MIAGTALFSLITSQLQVRYTLISYSLLPFAVFLTGSILKKNDALISQAAFALFYLLLSKPLSYLFKAVHDPAYFGYILGTVPACWLIAKLLESEKPSPVRKLFLLAGALLSAYAFFSMKDQVHIYYKFTLGLALALGFVYYLRLRTEVHVLIIYTSALLFYYIFGLAGLFLTDGGPALEFIFRGYFLLLPGDLLTLILSVYLIPPLANKMREQRPAYYAG